MSEYRVIITETLKRAVTVEAESREEAEEAVRRQYQNSEHILVAEDFDGVSFSAQYPKQQVELPYAAVVFTVCCLPMTAFAAGNDPLAVINNLSDFIFGVIRAVGLILLGWGIVQIGLSFQSHDPSQRSNGFLTLAGGVVVTFAKEILTLITG